MSDGCRTRVEKRQLERFLCSLDTILDHALEALLISIVNLRNLKVIFLELLDQLIGIKLAV
jgi:hypothetical protein